MFFHGSAWFPLDHKPCSLPCWKEVVEIPEDDDDFDRYSDCSTLLGPPEWEKAFHE